MSWAAVILAAGASRRLGRPKQLEIVGRERLLETAIRVSREAGCGTIVVVLGYHADEIQRTIDFSGVQIVRNAEWESGMGSSLAVGVRAAQHAEGILVLTCDMPFVTAAHLQALTASGELTGSLYAGSIGVPAFFPSHLLPQLTLLTGDVGAKTLLRGARALSLSTESLDIDNENDIRRARLLQRRSLAAQSSR